MHLIRKLCIHVALKWRHKVWSSAEKSWEIQPWDIIPLAPLWYAISRRNNNSFYSFNSRVSSALTNAFSLYVEAFKLSFSFLLFPSLNRLPRDFSSIGVSQKANTRVYLFSDQNGEIFYYLKKEREILFFKQILSVSRNYLKCAYNSKCPKITLFNSLKGVLPDIYSDRNYFLLRILYKRHNQFKSKTFQRKWESCFFFFL